MLIKASIIIPVYNAQNTIRRAIDSAVNQTTDEPYEVILINDGSKDGSAAILDAYASRYAYVRVIHQANQGITRTRENGIRAARGEYVFWVDADDYADKHLLAKTLPLLESGADVVVYGTQYFWENGGRAEYFGCCILETAGSECESVHHLDVWDTPCLLGRGNSPFRIGKVGRGWVYDHSDF